MTPTKLRTFVMALFALLFLPSCEKEKTSEQFLIDVFPEETNTPYHIPVEKALAELESFLSCIDGPATRAGSERRSIASVETFSLSEVKTRVLTDTTTKDINDILYIVNFGGDEGYALLAADSRIQETILSVVEKGSLTRSELVSYIQVDTRQMVDGYPTTGSGYLYLAAYPDETFINPNTFELYDELKDDSLVGDFFYTDDTGNEGITNIKKMIAGLSLNYAVNSIVGSEKFDRIQLPDPNEDGGSTSSNTVVVSDTTIVIDSIVPMLVAEKSWKQDTIFNEFCPNVRKYVLVGKKEKAAVGCVPLAIAKIMTHFKMPTLFEFNGYTVDWDRLNPDSSETFDPISAAALLRAVGLGCNSMYFYDGTFTYPKNAENYLSFCGYQGVVFTDYDTERVISALDNGCPVFVCSIPQSKRTQYNLGSSHGWNIDGYKKKIKITTSKYYTNGTYTHSTITTSEPFYKVHCDFGWGGNCNGYFASGIFKMNGKDVEFDDPTDVGDSCYYRHYLKTITYRNPQL